MGVFTIGNIGNSGLFDRSTLAIKTPFTKMDQITIGFDGTLTPVHAGPGMLPAWNITADRKPQVEIKGPELPLDGVTDILGANVTKAASGSPVIVPWMDYKTIAADGTVALDHQISATNATVSVVGGGTTYTQIASAPTTGQYVTPTSGDSSLTFSTSDAGKAVMISYNFDTTSGGQIDYMPTSIPGEHRFQSTAMLLDAEGGPDVPCAFIVYRCQLMSDWQIDQQRMKATSTDLKLNILDPGGSQPAISIIPTGDFV